MNKKLKEKKIIIGKIGKTIGIKGWLKIYSFFKIKKNIFDFLIWEVKKHNFTSFIRTKIWKYHYNQIIIKIKNINNIDQAKIFTNCNILTTKKEILTKNYFLINEIINYTIININKEKIGIIQEVIKTKINTILVIKQTKNKKIKLIPFIQNGIIKTINHKKKYIKINYN